MTAPVIHGEYLSKRYRRGLQVDTGLRHALEDFLHSPLAALRRPKAEMFWALENVSLSVHEGEVLGLIGRNGAGKTTLLKILSRITGPTEGWAEIHGRVGSLLEVGTGFHPELTGRENTFLSGAILGMSKAEISRKLGEIVACGDRTGFGEARSTDAKGQFLKWELAEPRTDPHVLTTLGSVTVDFTIEVKKPVANAEQGVALFNSDRQLMWARAAQNLSLSAGIHVLSHTFPSLPLRPGAYQWQVTFWVDGEMLDLWDCVPDMVIATDVHQHYMDEWNGILNLPSRFAHTTREELSVERTTGL